MICSCAGPSGAESEQTEVLQGWSRMVDFGQDHGIGQAQGRGSGTVTVKDGKVLSLFYSTDTENGLR